LQLAAKDERAELHLGRSPGKEVTYRCQSGRQEIGRGSLTTLLRLRNEILEPETPEIDRDPEALNAFRQTWQAAVEAGRKGEAGKTAEAPRTACL